MTEILTPDCPVCGHPPTLAVSATQACCGNDECRVLMWDPTRTIAENLADEHQVRLLSDDDPPPNQ